jgi:hypothetical protein
VGALFCFTPSEYPPRDTQPFYALHEGISWSTMLNSPSIQSHLHQSTMSNLHRTTRLSLPVLEIIKHKGNYNLFHYELRNGVSKQFYYEGCCHSSFSLPTLITADCLNHFRFWEVQSEALTQLNSAACSIYLLSFPCASENLDVHVECVCDISQFSALRFLSLVDSLGSQVYLRALQIPSI